MDTWNPTVIAEAVRRYDLEVYRLQSFQTRSLLRDLLDDEGELLALMESLKMDEILLTAFRKRPRWETRFRPAFAPGVFYAAAKLETAMAEIAYHQKQLLDDSSGLESLSLALINISAHLKGDLVDVELLPDREQIYLKDNYRPAQELALKIRELAMPGLHYLSVRSPVPASAFALFSPDVISSSLANPEPWMLTVTGTRTEFRSAQRVVEFHPGN